MEDQVIEKLKEIVAITDKQVTEREGSFMGNESCTIYEQEGVYKYAICKTAKGYTFHSMPMYVFREIAELTKSELPEVKLQKGCFNFKSPENLPAEGFQRIIKLSAETDYSGVIAHHKNKK
jgi:hypothetical protein